MNHSIFIILFSSLAILYFMVGIQGRKNVKTNSDYFVGGRNLGLLQISANLIATQLGGGIILGTAIMAYQSGLHALFYPLGVVIGFFILSMGLAGRMQSFDVITSAELFETRFKSKTLRKFASILSICTLFGILVAQVVCIKALLTALGYPFWVTALFWMLIGAYTTIGGIRAITLNDILQLAIIFATFIGISIYLSWTMSGEILELIQQIRLGTWGATSHAVLKPTRKLYILKVVLAPALFLLIEQDIAQRFFSAKSKRTATYSSFIAGAILLLFSLIPIALGMLCRSTQLVLISEENPLLALIKTHCSELIFSIVLCAVFAAVVSTADALINGICANITQDFELKRLFKDETKALHFSKAVSLLISLAALGALFIASDNILEILISSYEVAIAGLLVPLLYCYSKRTPSSLAGYTSVILGSLTYIVTSLCGNSDIKVVLSIGASFLGYQVGQEIERRSKPDYK
jgi:SSS family solute:Na+ symporter